MAQKSSAGPAWRCLTVLALMVCLGTGVWAQFRGGFRAAPRFPSADSFGHGFNYCRGMYTSVRGEAGGQGWSTDYPDADRHFSIRLAELTKTRVAKSPDGEPEYYVLRLTDDALFGCPFLQMSDVGTLEFSEAEVAALRAYLLKGGFLWVDDFWGSAAWDNWSAEFARVLPPSEYQVEDVPLSHPMFRTMKEVREVPQIPSIQFWRRGGDGTSERYEDSATPHLRGVTDRHGRLMVIMTHNTDIADAWEREDEDPEYFYTFSPGGYAVGINVLMYAMTH